MNNIISKAHFNRAYDNTNEVLVRVDISKYSHRFLNHMFSMWAGQLTGVYGYIEEVDDYDYYGKFFIDEEYREMAISESLKNEMVEYLNKKARWFGDGNYIGSGNEPIRKF